MQPAQNATNVRPGADLIWGASSPEELSYNVAVYETGMTNVLIGTGRVDRSTPGAGSIQQLSLAGFHIKENTEYAWGVQAVYQNGVVSNWSQMHVFRTGRYAAGYIVAVDAPANGATVSMNPLLKWDFFELNNPPETQKIFSLQISETQDFSEVVYFQTNIEEMTFQVPESAGLRPGQTYYWRVRLSSPTADGTWPLNLWRFVVEIPKTTLLAPADEENFVYRRAVLSWHTPYLEMQYLLEVARDPAFTQIVHSDTYNSFSTQLMGDELEYATGYYWRVSCFKPGMVCDPSEVRFFYTEHHPLIFPANNASDIRIRPEFRFTNNPVADAYYIFVSDNEATLWNAANRHEIPAGQTSFELPYDLEPDKKYYWTLGVEVGLITRQAPVWQFRTEIPVPAQVQLATPQNGAEWVSRRPQLRWNAVPYAQFYEVEMFRVGTGIIANQQIVHTTTYIIPNDLVFGGEYTWRVRASNGSVWGLFSEQWIFTTSQRAPELITPADESEGINVFPTFFWKNVDRVNGYRIRIGTDNALTQNVHIVEIMASNAPTTGFTLEDVPLAPGTTYFWRVEPYEPVNLGSPSVTWKFTTEAAEVTEPPAKVTLIRPGAGETGIPLRPEFEWQPLHDAEKYELVFATSQDLTENRTEITLSENAVSFIPAFDLLHETTYYWGVRAGNGNGFGLWSDTHSFTTIAAPVIPAVVSLVAPAQNATDISRRPVFLWRSANHGDDYTFQLSKNADFSELITVAAGLEDTTYTAGADLDYSALYFWRVNARNADGVGEWSPAAQFTVRAVPTSLHDSATHPLEFTLHSNYPNPFNPSTTIRFDLPEQAMVRIEVVDATGRQILSVPPQTMTAGAGKMIVLDASALSSGVYFYRVIADAAGQTNVLGSKFTLMK